LVKGLDMRIKNWRDYQHYSNRTPEWIKLHFDLLTSPTWVMLDDASRVLAVACMLIASRHNGEVPENADYVRRVAYLNTIPDFKPLLACGFLEKCENTGEKDGGASSVLADASGMQASACLEKNRVEENKRRREERRTLASLRSQDSLLLGEFQNVRLTTEEYAKIKEKQGDERTKEGIEVLSAYIANSKKGQKYTNHYAVMHARSWVWDEVDKRMPVQERDKPAPRHWDANTGPVL